MNKILFSASDPGGGNAILPVIHELQKQKIELFGIVDGPSKEIFNREKINFLDAQLINPNQLAEILSAFNPDLFVSGTSWGATIDKQILLWCKNQAVKSIYVLDFWTNYWQRFSREGKDFYFLPDYICVMDDLAKKAMCAEGFSSDILVVTGNPHFDHFIDDIQNDKEITGRILFVSQPLRHLGAQETIEEYGYDEYKTLGDLLKAMRDAPRNFELIIRLHPKEDACKFDSLMAVNGVRVAKDDLSNVQESISRSELVIGMNSMVLFQAAIAGKNVISYQPGLKREDSLISNQLGFSELITDYDRLVGKLKGYFAGSEHQKLIKQGTNKIIKNATQNVTTFIATLAKQGKEK